MDAHRTIDSRPSWTQASLLSLVRQEFGRRLDLTAPVTHRTVVVAVRCDAKSVADDVEFTGRVDRVMATCREGDIDARVGIGALATAVRSLVSSARDGHDALRLGRVFQPETRVHDIDLLRVHQALSVVPVEARERLSQSLLRGLRTDSEWSKLRDTLIAWGDSGFSPPEAAKALHIHRNTLSYRFDKISKILGRRVDDSGVSVAVYLACILDSEDDAPQ